MRLSSTTDSSTSTVTPEEDARLAELISVNARLKSDIAKLEAELEKRKQTVISLAQSNIRLGDVVEKLRKDVEHYKQKAEKQQAETPRPSVVLMTVRDDKTRPTGAKRGVRQRRA